MKNLFTLLLAIVFVIPGTVQGQEINREWTRGALVNLILNTVTNVFYGTNALDPTQFSGGSIKSGATITNASLTTATNSGVFNVGGALGIQTVNSTATLHVLSTNADGMFKVSSAHGTNNFLIKTNGNVQINTYGGTGPSFQVDTNSLVVTNGNTGFGTDSPGARIDSRTAGYNMQWGSASVVYGQVTYTAGTAQLYATTGNKLSLGANSFITGVGMIFDTNNYVGNGTLFPTASSHIYSISPDAAFKISTAFNTNVVVVTTNGTSNFGTNNGTARVHISAATNQPGLTIQFEATQSALTNGIYPFIDFRSRTGSEGSVCSSAALGTLTYTTFSGSHYTEVSGTNDPTLYALLEIIQGVPSWSKQLISPAVTNVVIVNNVDGTFTTNVIETAEVSYQASPKSQLFKTRVCRTLQSKSAIGAWFGKDREGRDFVASIGTGFLWVANKGTNIDTGDYLMSSDVLGCAERQSDDVKHNYTVGKATMSVDWAALGNPPKKLVKVVYQGG